MIIRGPNLFDYATSELSQDAALCWSIAWADSRHAATDPAMHAIGRDLVASMFYAAKAEAPKKEAAAKKEAAPAKAEGRRKRGSRKAGKVFTVYEAYFVRRHLLHDKIVLPAQYIARDRNRRTAPAQFFARSRSDENFAHRYRNFNAGSSLNIKADLFTHIGHAVDLRNDRVPRTVVGKVHKYLPDI